MVPSTRNCTDHGALSYDTRFVDVGERGVMLESKCCGTIWSWSAVDEVRAYKIHHHCLKEAWVKPNDQ